MLLSKLVDLIKSGDSKFIKANIIENIDIENAASLDIASKNQISFLEENNILKDNLGKTSASAIITSNNSEILGLLESLNISSIVVENPRIAFAEVLNSLYEQINFNTGIDDSTVIKKSAKIGENCYLGPNVYIGEKFNNWQ